MSSKLQRTLYLRKMLAIFSALLLLCAECLSNGCPHVDSPIVKCVNKNLTRIPSWIPSNITVLDLSKNPFLKIQEDSFLRFTNLSTLSVAYGCLHQPFKIPKSVKVIDIRNNLLSIESAAAMFRSKEESNILTIWIDTNNLKLDGDLSVFPVQFLAKIKSKMKTIRANEFKGLPNLISLDLAHNGIKSISDGAFDNLRQLKYIDLRGNNIQKLPRRLFQYNKKSDSINIKWNYLKEVPDLTGIKRLSSLALT